MTLLTGVSTLLLMTMQPVAAARLDTVPMAGDRVAVTSITVSSTVTDSVANAAPVLLPDGTSPMGAAPRPVALSRWSAATAASGNGITPDTVPRKRAKAVVYSDGYGKRLALHKTLSWAMLPLFAVSYVSGDQLIKNGSDAPEWARTIHPIAATSTAVLFGVNTVTGTWNLWEGRRDANGRMKRLVHGALFMVASGGFAYTGSKLANEAQENQSKRESHRNLAIASMGMSTASWLIMLIGN
jgi:hypothetical protein